LHAAAAETLTHAGFEILTTTRDAAPAMPRHENKRWGPILPDLNIRLD